MTSSAITLLELADLAPSEGGRETQPLLSLRWPILASLAGLAALAAGPSLEELFKYKAPDAAIKVSPQALRSVIRLNSDDRSQIIAEGREATARNAQIPVVAPVKGQVSGFVLPLDNASARTALHCLTQAVYYEAAVEPLEGRRAVAQAVLNRVRHPAYPGSVCGVVYQGSQQRTGCQFSFTCDGSLLRTPMAKAWGEAEQVARDALSGYVEKRIGTATHYHADYVLPRWAFELSKVGQIGRHEFYRFGGGWGSVAMLSKHYSGIEVIPPLNFGLLRERVAGAASFEPVQFVPGLTVTPSITDRHAATDVGGRLDTSRPWRLSIPDPVAASARYRGLVDGSDRQDTTVVAGNQPATAAQP